MRLRLRLISRRGSVSVARPGRRHLELADAEDARESLTDDLEDLFVHVRIAASTRVRHSASSFGHSFPMGAGEPCRKEAAEMAVSRALVRIGS